ncbi:DNA binding protein [Coprinopsis marcescibilis]|uniref:DNA binding protein n=1 Tax=Coprinopsis marcescibilis TaxID=230819 RepID=A0A5C3KPQ4_COPMA|nr:DNA binding protein [Coprinopsis marcescibilis]
MDIATEPRPIKKLDKTLINRIAAGEIIHRPASALKELIENSLDAGSTSIKVTVRDGGLKLLQIQDNGCGIRKSDLPILAERFTTSKLSTFSDLARIATYGFRGEALASISHVARLSVVTKTKNDACAWKAYYVDGALSSNKPGRSPEPEPCAGNDGTTIIVENLFYNTPTRLSALRNNSDEYAKILDVMTKYAVHNPKISFLCKKAGSPSPELTTPPNLDIPQAIGLLYGHSIAKELLHNTVSSSSSPGDDMDVDSEEGSDTLSGSWSADIYFTNPNYQAKKFNFLLFINHRLVESPRMKRALEAAYHSILPKSASPFVYLSLNIDPKCVDVNVHPTKREVHFLDEEGITEKICNAVQASLSTQAASRSYEYQTMLTSQLTINKSGDPETSSLSKGKQKATDEDMEGIDAEEVDYQKTSAKPKVYSHHKVRTSAKDRTLDSMFPVLNPAQKAGQGPIAGPNPSEASTQIRETKESECFLTSVVELRKQVQREKHRQLAEILEKHIFVGIIDMDRCLSLLQSSTNLYMVNHAALAEELFYQLGLRQFGDFARLKLEPSPSIHQLLQIALDNEDTTESDLSKSELVKKIADILLTRREMLSEYFSLDITEGGLLESIPLLLREYIPNLDNLPSLLMRLGPQINWTSEKECFETFLRELAYFYTPLALFPGIDDTRSSRKNNQSQEGEEEQDDRDSNAANGDEAEARERADKWQIQHVLFPAMRRYLVPPKSLLDGDIVQVASLPDLYKVFERC